MRRGICVKCGGNEVYAIEGSRGSYQDLMLGGGTVFSESSSHFYVCAGCGYCERYLNPQVVDKLRRKGARVTG